MLTKRCFLIKKNTKRQHGAQEERTDIGDAAFFCVSRDKDGEGHLKKKDLV